jgi:hypothetical protein
VKPRNREVSIFNMSVLDLLTGALGAFCFLTLALFPYYFKATGASAAVSATDSAQAAKAAAALKAINVKLKSELATTKAGGRGMPPFMMAQFAAEDANGNTCGGYQITDYSGPGGMEAIKLLPFAVSSNGYSQLTQVFMVAPGTYTISGNAYGNGGGCHLMFNSFPNSPVVQLGASLAPFSMKLQVTPDQLQFAEVLSQ